MSKLENYLVTFTHRISSRPEDKIPIKVKLPPAAFDSRAELAKALREAGVLPAGHRVRTFRVDGDRVFAFPLKGWHCITIWKAPQAA